ncbi:hypothetical protein WA026_015888 [Henosepilachna vigintioctopunctata]|uniref:Uncharacterized protein n=1 Tax=Henosepilachna vigintioctopunctata TaxID=420089 RepID=A0AAW1UZQ5_9CUCU|nr:coleoptericin 1 [Henosepilachna vigintioctopunctata]
MASTISGLLLVCCVVANSVLSYPLDHSELDLHQFLEEDIAELQPSINVRYVRSLQPGAPNFPIPGSNNGRWQLDPSLSRDKNGNTKGSINVQHSGRNHQVNAKWEKVIRGPNRAKPVWSIHGSYKW